jgi:ElaB/YqjD/DUF883 family membrane-anchored ribosome-binding protein
MDKTTDFGRCRCSECKSDQTTQQVFRPDVYFSVQICRFLTEMDEIATNLTYYHEKVTSLLNKGTSQLAHQANKHTTQLQTFMETQKEYVKHLIQTTADTTISQLKTIGQQTIQTQLQQIESQAKETYESIKQQMDQTLTQALETINTTSNQTAAKIKDTYSTTDTAPQGIYSK